MRLNPFITALLVLGLVSLSLGVAWIVLRPSGPALTEASASLTTITPNADGVSDVTRFTYILNRPASISIYFINESGQRFYFRRDRARESGEHSVEFSGIVEAYTLPTDAHQADLLRRVLHNGTYQWVIDATDNAGPAGTHSGTLTITDADTSLPDLENFTVGLPLFSPNQDGINDRVLINVNLAKDVAPAGLRVFLISPTGAQLDIPEKIGAIKFGARGLHTYDYDGGIDQGQDPPPDGTYVIRAEVEDLLGQRMAVSQTLTIEHGGLPRAEVWKGDVEWSAKTMLVGQTLYFTLTVENYGNAPIRTSGPNSGYVYPSMSANYNGAGEQVQAGAWRVGIMCENCLSDFPWRWALGTADTLTALQENGQTYYYLLPGDKVTVTGGIVLDNFIPERNPQYFWAGLIHEDVAIANVNNRVDPWLVKVEQP